MASLSQFISERPNKQMRAGTNTHKARVGVDPSSCVRAPNSEWFAYESDCLLALPAGKQCNQEWVNSGYTSSYTPWGRDSISCNGPVAPNILPQTLGDESLIEAECSLQFSELSLDLMTGGHVGVFKFKFQDAPGGNSVVFDQTDQLTASLFIPALYQYVKPFNGGVIKLSLNLTSGEAEILFPFENNGCSIRYFITSIPTWANT